MSEHRVVIEFDDGLYARLICPGPGKGCHPATQCASCGRDIREDGEGCYDCKDGFGDECWIKGWFDNLMADELLRGKIEVPVEAEFDGESAVVHILDNAPTPTQPKTEQETASP